MTHIPTDTTRAQVESLVIGGVKQTTIADILGIAPKTLRAHYRRELDHALAKVIAGVSGTLIQKALSGSETSMIFFLKTRAGWRETVGVDLNGKVDISQQADSAKRKLAALVTTASGEQVDSESE